MLAFLLAVLVAAVWSVHWVVIKIGLASMPPLWYGVLRLTTALLTVVAILLLRRRLRRPSRDDIPVVLSVGTLQIAASILLMNFALQIVPAGRSSILAYSMPVWAALLAWLVLRRRSGEPRWSDCSWG